MSNHIKYDLARLLGKEFVVEVTGGPHPSLIITKVSNKKSIRMWASEHDRELLHTIDQG